MFGTIRAIPGMEDAFYSIGPSLFFLGFFLLILLLARFRVIPLWSGPLSMNGPDYGSSAKLVVTSSAFKRRESSFSLMTKTRRGGTHYSDRWRFFVAALLWLENDPHSDPSSATRSHDDQHQPSCFLPSLPDPFAARSLQLHTHRCRCMLYWRAGKATAACTSFCLPQYAVSSAHVCRTTWGADQSVCPTNKAVCVSITNHWSPAGRKCRRSLSQGVGNIRQLRYPSPVGSSNRDV
jgi:hypothetical protein